MSHRVEVAAETAAMLRRARKSGSVVTHNNRAIGVVVSRSLLQELEDLRDAVDGRAALAAWRADDEATVPWPEVKASLRTT